MLPISGITATGSTPEIRFFDQVLSLLREAGYNFSPEWEEVRNGFQKGQSAEEVANYYMEKWDVD